MHVLTLTVSKCRLCAEAVYTNRPSAAASAAAATVTAAAAANAHAAAAAVLAATNAAATPTAAQVQQSPVQNNRIGTANHRADLEHSFEQTIVYHT